MQEAGPSTSLGMTMLFNSCHSERSEESLVAHTFRVREHRRSTVVKIFTLQNARDTNYSFRRIVGSLGGDYFNHSCPQVSPPLEQKPGKEIRLLLLAF